MVLSQQLYKIFDFTNSDHKQWANTGSRAYFEPWYLVSGLGLGLGMYSCKTGD